MLYFLKKVHLGIFQILPCVIVAYENNYAIKKIVLLLNIYKFYLYEALSEF